MNENTPQSPFKENPGVITMSQANAQRRLQNNGGVEEAQRAVDAAEDALKVAKERLLLARQDAATALTASNPENAPEAPQKSTMDDPGEHSGPVIQEWLNTEPGADEIKRVLKAEKSANGKQRSTVIAMLDHALEKANQPPA